MKHYPIDFMDNKYAYIPTNSQSDGVLDPVIETNCFEKLAQNIAQTWYSKNSEKFDIKHLNNVAKKELFKALETYEERKHGSFNNYATTLIVNRFKRL